MQWTYTYLYHIPKTHQASNMPGGTSAKCQPGGRKLEGDQTTHKTTHPGLSEKVGNLKNLMFWICVWGGIDAGIPFKMVDLQHIPRASMHL